MRLGHLRQHERLERPLGLSHHLETALLDEVSHHTANDGVVIAQDGSESLFTHDGAIDFPKRSLETEPSEPVLARWTGCIASPGPGGVYLVGRFTR